MNLTQTSYKIYAFIKDYLNKHPYSPNTTEIAHGIGLKSRGVIPRYLKQLEDAGLIMRTPNKHRNITIVQTESLANDNNVEQLIPLQTKPTPIPLVGCIAAGKPIEALLDQQPLNLADIFFNENHYALRVKGDSMIEEGIFDGDIVVCQHTQQAQNGHIIVALIDDERATLKRYHYDPQKNIISLIPANSNMSPMHIEAHRVRIQGRYLGLLRMA